ncbi:MAG: glycosyltransferase [Lacunisphaera sp.]|nr:glycosyltransferase [Lacunisphaera sp.]
MKVSFIIPLYNCLPLTQAMLASLRATLPAGLDYEIVFVDDGSTDGTREWLPTLPEPCRSVLNERNAGFAATCNRGAEAASGGILIFLNNDLVLLPGWLEPMLDALTLNPTIGLVGNRQNRVDNDALDHAGMEVTVRGKITHRQSLPAGRITAATLLEVPGVTAACLAVRRQDFLKSGRFDEGFLNGGEDVDLCFRLRTQLQLSSVVALGSVVRHHVSAARGPTNERDERNSRRLTGRWHDEFVYWGALTWARAQVAQHLATPWTRAGRQALAALPFARGWTRRPPETGRLRLVSALHREAVRWQRLFDLPPDAPRAPRGSSQYREQGFYRDDVEVHSAWLREVATIDLPAGFPASNVFLNGFVLPPPPGYAEAGRTLSFRVRLNGTQVVDFPDLPVGNFNCGVDAPFVLPDRPTRIEIEIVGVRFTNFLAWFVRMTRFVPLPPPWRRAVNRFRRQARNRRLRFRQLVCDDEVILDFKRHPALKPLLRTRLRPTGVNLIGWFRAALGIGESVRCMAKACDAAGLPATLIEMKLHCLNPHGDDTYTARLETEPRHQINIFHLDPPVSESLDHHHGPALRTDRYNIAYWAWELPEFPEAWVRQCAYFDEIWCPSEFVRAAIAAKVDLPVQVMPHAIDFPLPPADGRARFGLPAGRCLFLFAYDLNSYQERKNPLAVIEAYRRAFPGEPGVGLVIKTQNPGRNAAAYRQLQAALAGLAHVTLITETLARADVYRLELACDVFVSLHRAEGFGLAVAECMFLGKPVVATDWSATAEFLDATNGAPVRYLLTTLQETHGPYQAGQTWAEPDIDHAAEWMRRLQQDPALAARLGQAARATIQARFAPAVVGALYRSRLAALCANQAAP